MDSRMQVHDLTGQQFGKLTVICRVGSNKRGRAMWKCVCECGRTSIVVGTNLISGKTHSCGCLSRKHGKARKERLYNIWVGMRQRCRDKNSKDYKRYGGRGIAVCPSWEDYRTFRDWAMSSGYEDTLTIDRIDSNGNYEPNNCRWASYKEQNNNLRSNVMVIYEEEEMTMKQLAEKVGMSYTLLKQRLSRGWTVEKAVNTPSRKKKTYAIST